MRQSAGMRADDRGTSTTVRSGSLKTFRGFYLKTSLQLLPPHHIHFNAAANAEAEIFTCRWQWESYSEARVTILRYLSILAAFIILQ